MFKKIIKNIDRSGLKEDESGIVFSPFSELFFQRYKVKTDVELYSILKINRTIHLLMFIFIALCIFAFLSDNLILKLTQNYIFMSALIWFFLKVKKITDHMESISEIQSYREWLKKLSRKTYLLILVLGFLIFFALLVFSFLTTVIYFLLSPTWLNILEGVSDLAWEIIVFGVPSHMLGVMIVAKLKMHNRGGKS